MTRAKRVFLYTVIIGLATHMYRFTNWMLCADSTNYLNTISKSWVTSVGRYLLPVVETIRGNHELPWLFGLFCTVMLALTAVVVCELFDVKGTVSQILVGWIIAGNPMMTATYAYMYTADGYMIGLFLAVLSVYLSVKKPGWKGMVAGAVALFVSLGFYQGYMTTTVLLFLFQIILLLLDRECSIKDIGTAIGRYLLTGVIAIGAYLIVVKTVWTLGGYGVTTYMGIGESSGLHIDSFLSALKDCYVDFARVFLVRWKWTAYNVMNILMFGMTGIFLIWQMSCKKIWKQPIKVVLLALILVMLPVATHLFEFLSEELSYSTTIMDYGTAMVFLLPVILWGTVEKGEGNFSEWKENEYRRHNRFWLATALLMLCICCNFTIIANKAYVSMENANKNVEMLLNRVLTRMEMQPEYSDCMEMMVVGSCYQYPEYVTNAPMMSGVVSNIFLTTDIEYINLMNHTLSTSFWLAPPERAKEIAAMEEFREMLPWPAESSVKIIDGTMVVVLSYNNIESLYE